jgi:glycosyltransferase involved in cell wall biosynthesis
MDLRNKNIFILGLAKYNTEIESTTFTLAKHLARHNQVFYIENPYTWKDLLLSKKHREQRKKKQLLSTNDIIETGTPNLKVIMVPPLASINGLPEGKIYRAMLKANERIIVGCIEKVIKEHGISNYIFINSYNFYYPDVARMLNPDLVAYHCVDPLVYPTELRHGMISEHKIVTESDLVICTSKRLYNEKVNLNRNTHFIPNAADIQHSSKALQPHLSVHERIANIKPPIVGYFGNIERRIDYKLIDALTEAHPNINFVFAGPIIKEFIPAWFYERANIHLTGPVPYEAMPRVLKGFDVAMIPFKKDEASPTIFPLKLFEYLGAGKPVVATDFNPDLQDFTGTAVAFCDNALSFAEAIQNSLYKDTEELRERRMAIAAQNTWEKRGDEFCALINAYFSKANMEKLNAEEYAA